MLCCRLIKRSSYYLFGSFYFIGSNGNMKEFQVMNLLQVLTLMPASIYLRNNGVDLLYEEGVNGTWRNVLILAAGLIWLNLMGIVCHAMKGFSVFVNATAQVGNLMHI